MRRIELALAFITVIAIIYKILFGPELNILLIITLTSLSVFYTYFSFIYFNRVPLKQVFQKGTYESISKMRIIVTIALGIGFGITLLGILWSLMSWPFNNFYLLGVPLILLSGSITFIKYTFTKSESYVSLLKRVLVIGIFGIAFWINPNKAFSKYQDVQVVKEQVEENNDPIPREPL